MRDAYNQQNDSNEQDELTEQELDFVAGGLNPQPEPPGVVTTEPLEQ